MDRRADVAAAELSFLAGSPRGLYPVHRHPQGAAAVLQCALDPQRARPHQAASGQPDRGQARPHAHGRRRDVDRGRRRAGEPRVRKGRRGGGRGAMNPALAAIRT
ncbi:hypothetical protein KO15_14615, partial [Listeria monocytogenes]